MPRNDDKSASARYAYQGLERSIHEKARLGIMTSLLTNPEGVAFNDLKSLCELTDGNLSRHLDVLLEDGLIAVDKVQSAGRPKTMCRLTASGRKRFLTYLNELQRVVTDATEAATLTAKARLRLSTDG